MDLLIFGAGAQAHKALLLAVKLGFNIIGSISTEVPGTYDGLTVLGDLNYYLLHKELHHIPVHIGIGENAVRSEIYKRIADLAKDLISLISPEASISQNTKIGKGTYIGVNATLLNNVDIKQNCLIDTGSIIEHDVIIEDYVTISPNATISGRVYIHQGVIIGAGATVIEKVHIGKHSLIGAGSVVINDVEPNVVVVGNPARVIRTRSDNELYLR